MIQKKKRTKTTLGVNTTFKFNQRLHYSNKNTNTNTIFNIDQNEEKKIEIEEDREKEVHNQIKFKREKSTLNKNNYKNYFDKNDFKYFNQDKNSFFYLIKTKCGLYLIFIFI